MNITEYMQQELQTLKEHSNLRRLPQLTHEGRTVVADGRRMLNLSSNDYLGLAADRQLREEFLQTLTPDTFLPTSSSSRLQNPAADPKVIDYCLENLRVAYGRVEFPWRLWQPEEESDPIAVAQMVRP